MEFDVRKELGESDSDSKASNSVVSGAVDPLVIGSTDLVNYYGSTVRSGYATQPVTTLIHIPDAQAAFGTGTAVVAIIDTGINPTTPRSRTASSVGTISSITWLASHPISPL